MIRTILVPVSGTNSDGAVFATALAVAEISGAHLAFQHVRVTRAAGAPRSPHMAAFPDLGLKDAAEVIDRTLETLSDRAAAHVEEFCFDYGIALGQRPNNYGQVTASWSDAAEQDIDSLLARARHADLTVLGRPRRNDPLPLDLIDALLLKSGRPVVLASEEAPPPPAIETIMIGWKECPEAARALSAAMPLLRRAKTVFVTHIRESGERGKSTGDLVYHLARHGITAERKEVAYPGADAVELLPALAAALEVDLLVMGGYSRQPGDECIFGGVTRSIIEHAPLPVFLLH